MIHRIAVGLLALAMLVVAPLSAAEPAREKDSVEQVRKAIGRGKKFLHETQNENGSWEDPAHVKGYNGGWTALAILALLYAGDKPDSPAVQRGLTYLRKIQSQSTYAIGLQTMALAEAGQADDLPLIRRNVQWLIDARVMPDGQMNGWYYTKSPRNADNSNTQYALLGLHAGKTAGAEIKREIWESIHDYYLRTQNEDSGWGYVPGRESTLTMTTAGLCGLAIAGMELNEGREKFRADNTVENCGEYPENEPAKKAMGWISQRFTIKDAVPHIFYNLYGIERAGRLSGERFFGDHDWYRAGCEYLVKNQRDDGSWYIAGREPDNYQAISTSFALLFLSKGRTPVLISKLVHGPVGNLGSDWNNDRNDARHLTEFVSKELFKRQPLAWQVFNTRQTGIDNPDDLAAELLQSPIAYFNGHRRPNFTGVEKKMLKQFIENGGFILADACCGQPAFDAGFRELMTELFPEKEQTLKPLRADHPIWTSYYKISERWPLEGIEFGCKTVVVYSPKDLSCRWEADPAKGPSQLAYRLGANIVAYATGMELPKPKGFKMEVAATKIETKVPRGYLKVAQLKHGNDRHSTAGVMRNLMAYLRDHARVDVALQTEEVTPGDKELLHYKFIYMHGKGDFAIEDVEVLRSNLQTGGVLFADACCGKKAFDTAFRKFAEKLFPGKKLEPIPVDDALYGKELNGTAITRVRCRREPGQAGYQDVAPYLEGIKIDGRWAVIYSKYDIGCALEKHQSSDCLGHDHASALRLASAAVLYALQH